MKLPKSIAGCLLLAVVATGCQTHIVVPISNGYEEVSHPSHTFLMLDEPLPPRISFQHRNTDGSVTPIWSSLYGVNDVVQGDLAIFVADKAYMEPDRALHPRLFAVRSPDVPLDITDEVLRYWAQANGKDFNRTLEKSDLVTPEDKNGGLQLDLEFSTDDQSLGRDVWPTQSSLQLDWRQVDAIMQTVKARGVQDKDLRWHTPYIRDKY